MQHRPVTHTSVLALAGLAILVALSAPAEASHARIPQRLTQINGDQSPLSPGSTTVGASVILGCDHGGGMTDAGDYKMEYEVRPLSQPFTGQPTHQSTNFDDNNPGGGGTPPVTVSNLTPSTGYHWQVRNLRNSGGQTSSYAQFNNGQLAFTVAAGGGGAVPSSSTTSILATIAALMGLSLMGLRRS